MKMWKWTISVNCNNADKNFELWEVDFWEMTLWNFVLTESFYIEIPGLWKFELITDYIEEEFD
jgi:hypothetical protein